MPDCAYIKSILNMPQAGPKFVKVLNMAKSSEYGKALNMRALHSVLNTSEYALTEL